MGFDAEKMISHLRLMYSGIDEHVHGTFLELAMREPERAVKELPTYIERALNEGNNFFRGMMCGGPAPEATAPLLDTFGGVYFLLEKPVRHKALEACLSVLDKLDYPNAQNNVERINEPWLCRDILVNRVLYWCGYKNYEQRLKKVKTWKEFKQEFFVDDKPRFASWFWLAYTLRERDGKDSVPPAVRTRFAAEYPEIVDRIKDARAGLIHVRALARGTTGSAEYEQATAAELKKYTAWDTELREKLCKADWILLPEAEQRLQRQRTVSN